MEGIKKKMSTSLITSLRSLHEIEQTIIENGGDMTIDLIKSIEHLLSHIENKVDSSIFIMENMKERSKYWAEKSALTKKYAQNCEGIADKIKETVKAYMYLKEQSSLIGDDNRFALSKIASVLKIDESVLPPEFFKEEIVRSVDKAKIKEILNTGECIEGVTLIDNFALRTYPNRKRYAYR